MILADTSVWVDHFRRGDAQLSRLLEQRRIVMHAFIVGELACGNLTDRVSTLTLLAGLPMAPVAEPIEAIEYIERHGLHGRGIGLVDVHLLMSATLVGGTSLWTRDKRLGAAASALGLAAAIGH